MTYNKTLLNSIHTPLKKSQGGGAFNGKPTVKQIMQMPDKKYAPSPAVMNTKAGLAAASMISGPFSFIPGTASAVYDLGTSARYAMDGQWENAKEDLISAGLNAIPTAGVYAALAGMGKLQKAARARAAIRSAKGAMNLKDLAGSSTIRNNMTGLVQEFDKAGKEISSMRPRSAAEVKAYNQNLKNQYRTGATPEGPAELMPFRSPDFASGGMITDPMGQWAHPGKNTRIPGSDITMQGVPYPVYGVGSNGQEQMMYPEQEYDFGGSSYVDEYPMMQIGGTMLNDKTNNMYFEDSNNLDMYGKGGQMIRRADGSYSKRGLWDNIRANKGSGKKPTKQMLEQEKKIKSKNYADGGTNNPGFEALPEYVQAKILSNMGYGGYYNPIMEEGGEPNGGMALGQMAAVVDKMSKLRKFVSEDENLDPWIASKLAVMDHSAAAIADYMMYNPEAQESEEEMGEEENYEQEEMPEMGRGGYTVTRSSDRKGKTHKVTGPDGTVKYFGDSKLGQHPKDPERKKAFYARHKKNLAGNPYFRAFARATWAEGGSTFSGNAWYGNGGTNNPGFKALPEFVQNQILSNMAYGGIHINPANEGKFTASAKAAGMGVQEFASHVLANKEDYSSTQVKRANFAHNAAGWKKAMGGPIVGQEMEVSAKELEELRKQGYQFEIL